MAFNITTAVQDMQDRLKTQEATDSVELEKCFHEFKTELYIKRDQVKQLRQDLETANWNIKELQKALDLANKSYEEKNFTLAIVQKKSRHAEEELILKREALMKNNMQQKITTAQTETLKTKLMETETEKNNLSRKLEKLEAKQKHNLVYHDEFLRRENDLRKFMGEVSETVTQLKAEQLQAVELSKKTKLAEESLEKLVLLNQNYESLRIEKENVEELYVKLNGKYEKLQELMSTTSDIKELGLWKANTSRYEAQIKEKCEILTKLGQSYNEEKTTNTKLIYQNAGLKKNNEEIKEEIKNVKESNAATIQILTEKVERLENQIRELAASQAPTASREVKDEPIEIED